MNLCYFKSILKNIDGSRFLLLNKTKIKRELGYIYQGPPTILAWFTSRTLATTGLEHENQP